MDYAYSFLVKVSVSVLLTIATFNIWKSDGPELFDWFMPFIALFWIIITIFEGVKVKKGNKWFAEKEEQDERTLNHGYKAGYVAFWVNITMLSLLFFIYSIVGFHIIQPMYVLISLVFLNIAVYFGLKLYFIFYN
ncbi:hypothetical protein [Alkalibacillus salilacus]|uniref:Energy-coupling factor transporter transmembrane protein EcfT n=1 Tax=Alkalibacillus salilacus TaxID=284582 RepID=A0ABT9VEV5_9BACI|nr:hypothetical protein [Alkalibacillus salilacus]MDQ0159483.1 energy-coupling factor transporter transmembrane protein EcfT [Alkalibacillus salilacus]